MALVEVHVEAGEPGSDDAPPAVHARVGDDVVVRLPDQSGGTGYAWTAVAVPDVLAPAGDAVQAALGTGASTAPGAAGAHVFSYRAVSAGAGTLTLALARSWESAPLRTVTVDVRVGPDA